MQTDPVFPSDPELNRLREASAEAMATLLAARKAQDDAIIVLDAAIAAQSSIEDGFLGRALNLYVDKHLDLLRSIGRYCDLAKASNERWKAVLA